jgi:hypothetical protein
LPTPKGLSKHAHAPALTGKPQLQRREVRGNIKRLHQGTGEQEQGKVRLLRESG